MRLCSRFLANTSHDACRETAQCIIERLSADDRALLHLWMSCGDWGRVATALGISRSAVYKRWSVLRSRIREQGTEAVWVTGVRWVCAVAVTPVFR